MTPEKEQTFLKGLIDEAGPQMLRGAAERFAELVRENQHLRSLIGPNSDDPGFFVTEYAQRGGEGSDTRLTRRPIAEWPEWLRNGFDFLTILDPEAQYHEDAMRTAAGPEVFHRERMGELSVSGSHWRYNGATALVDALADFIHAGRVLSAMKATLFYGKGFQPHDRADVDALFANFHHDQFDNYQMLHAILGIGSEAGELLEDVVALVSLPDPADVEEGEKRLQITAERIRIRDNMGREQGDIDWFQELFAHTIGIPVAASRRHNVERLKARFPDKFNEADALERKDEDPPVFTGGCGLYEPDQLCGGFQGKSLGERAPWEAPAVTRIEPGSAEESGAETRPEDQ